MTDLEAKVNALIRHAAATCSACQGNGGTYVAKRSEDAIAGTWVWTDCETCRPLRNIRETA